MHSRLIRESPTTYDFHQMALCKETIQIWDDLKMKYREIRCNCVW